METFRNGSTFGVQARPVATACGYDIVFTLYGIGFLSPQLVMQVWARGSKVTSDGYFSQY
jgi:hypothetical protein